MHKKKAREWQTRLAEEIKHNKNGKFVTLTFSNESIAKLCEEKDLKYLNGYELDNGLATKAVRLWLERWRKKYKTSIRHWLVTELGHNGTENIHLHGIVWTDVHLSNVERTWQYGFIWKGKGEKLENYVTNRTVNYITKYITKIDEKHKEYKPKILTSAGIGSHYTQTLDAQKNTFNGSETKEYYRTGTGHKVELPIYWRNKIYNDEEKEKLWLQKLDKNERWICGEKIKADDTEEYFKLLEWHRQRNAQLGYGDNKRDETWWKRKEYEKAQREINLLTRIQNASGGAPHAGEAGNSRIFDDPGPMAGEPG